MTVYVIGVDGGLSTGVAELHDGARTWFRQTDADNALAALENRLAWHADHPDHTVVVAYEVYRQAGRRAMSYQNAANDVASKVVALAARYGYQSVGQPPAEAKRIAPDHVLRNTGLWTLPHEVGQEDAHDVNDGMRHAVLALARQYATLYDALLIKAYGR